MDEQVDLDAPEAFDELTALEREQLRAWIRQNLEPSARIGLGKHCFSYRLKHLAEKALGWYVSNGQMKGAMLAEGYRWRQCEGTPCNPSPNWVFNSRRKRAARHA